MTGSTRRELLAATALLALGGPAVARTVSRALPWSPNQAWPVSPVTGGPLLFLTDTEAAMVEAIVARLIPADELGPGAKEAGCTVFIDRQLAGPYGGHEWLYMQGPFPPNPLPSQGLQSPADPARSATAGARGAGRALPGAVRRRSVPAAYGRGAGQAARRAGEGPGEAGRRDGRAACSR